MNMFKFFAAGVAVSGLMAASALAADLYVPGDGGHKATPAADYSSSGSNDGATLSASSPSSDGATASKSASGPEAAVPSSSAPAKQTTSDLLGKPADSLLRKPEDFLAKSGAGLLGKTAIETARNAPGMTTTNNAASTASKAPSNAPAAGNSTQSEPRTAGVPGLDSLGKPVPAGSGPAKSSATTMPAAGTSVGSGTAPVASTSPSGNQVAATMPSSNTPESLLNKPATKIGQLNCDVATGIGLIIGSTKRLDCSFSSPGRPAERYTGHIDLLGLDIGITGKSKLSWDVLAPNGDKLAPGSLAGTFSGASAEATAGVGVGGKALLHGNRTGFRLHPTAAGNQQTGLDVAGGVTAMTLNYAAN